MTSALVPTSVSSLPEQTPLILRYRKLSYFPLEKFTFLLFLICCCSAFGDRIPLCIPGTISIAQPGLKLKEICWLLLPKCLGWRCAPPLPSKFAFSITFLSIAYCIIHEFPMVCYCSPNTLGSGTLGCYFPQIPHRTYNNGDLGQMLQKHLGFKRSKVKEHGQGA